MSFKAVPRAARARETVASGRLRFAALGTAFEAIWPIRYHASLLWNAELCDPVDEGVYMRYGCNTKDGMTVNYYADAACTDKISSGEGWDIPYTYGGNEGTCIWEMNDYQYYEVYCGYETSSYPNADDYVPSDDAVAPTCDDGSDAVCCDGDGSCSDGDDDWCCGDDYYCRLSVSSSTRF